MYGLFNVNQKKWRRFPNIYRRFNVHKKKCRPTRLFPNQPRMANCARSMKEGGGGDGSKFVQLFLSKMFSKRIDYY